jgi:hypothetical protein
MNLLRELALQRSEQVHQLMGFVAALGVAGFTVDQFLNDNMPGGIIDQIGALSIT